MSVDARDEKDVYGGNFTKAKRFAIARSDGKCQFCGLREASDGHHWAWPDYPSGEEVQGHDITALCKTCHELATMLRDWVGRKDADFDQLGTQIADCDNFYAKRAAFSLWLYPDFFVTVEKKDKYYSETQDSGALEDIPALPKFKESGSIKSQMYGWQVQIEYFKDVRSAIERQMKRLERGENLNSYAAMEDNKEIALATGILPNPTWDDLDAEYKSVGRQIADAIRERERLRKQQGETDWFSCFLTLGVIIAICMVGIVTYTIFNSY